MKHDNKNKINFDQVEELDWQANENYPWEYEVKDEVWLADLSKISSTQNLDSAAEPATAERGPAKGGKIKVSVSEQIISEAEKLDEKVTVVDTELKFESNQETEVFEPSETMVSTINDEWFESQKQEKQVAVEKKLSFDWSDNFSWVFASLILFAFVLVGEIGLHYISQHWYWSANYLLLSLWLWRIAVLITWFYLGARRWFLATEQIMITAVLGQLVAVFVSGIYRIFVIKSLWTWLNLVVEPIWMLLIIAVAGSLFVRIVNK